MEAVNKCDLGQAAPAFPGAILISARTGEGLESLRQAIERELQRGYLTATFFLPFAQYGLLGQLRPLGRVLSEEYSEEGLTLQMTLAQSDLERIVGRFGAEILVSPKL